MKPQKTPNSQSNLIENEEYAGGTFPNLKLFYIPVVIKARRSNKSILKEISSEYSLKGLMLKLQYFGHLMQRTNSLEKTMMMGKIEGRRRRERQRIRW